MILCRVDGVQLREATAVRAVPLRRDRAGAMRYQNRAMHDRRAASRVEQWLEATRWSVRSPRSAVHPAMKLLQRSDAPAVLIASLVDVQ